MYYREKFEDEKWWCKTTPSGPWKEFNPYQYKQKSIEIEKSITYFCSMKGKGYCPHELKNGDCDYEYDCMNKYEKPKSTKTEETLWTSEEVLKELEQCDHLDDAKSFFNQNWIT